MYMGGVLYRLVIFILIVLVNCIVEIVCWCNMF